MLENMSINYCICIDVFFVHLEWKAIMMAVIQGITNEGISVLCILRPMKNLDMSPEIPPIIPHYLWCSLASSLTPILSPITHKNTRRKHKIALISFAVVWAGYDTAHTQAAAWHRRMYGVCASAPSITINHTPATVWCQAALPFLPFHCLGISLPTLVPIFMWLFWRVLPSALFRCEVYSLRVLWMGRNGSQSSGQPQIHGMTLNRQI